MLPDYMFPKVLFHEVVRGEKKYKKDYYAKSGGILEPMPRYEKMYERVRG